MPSYQVLINMHLFIPMFYLNVITVKFLVQEYQITFNHSQDRRTQTQL